MRAMILAAGRGERLRPLTDTLPKPMVPIGDKPLIAWHIEHLARAGFREIVINLGHLGELIRERVGDGSEWGVSIHWSVEQPEPLETGGGIFKALPLLGSSPFLVVNGDIWTNFPFARFRAVKCDWAHLLMVNNPAHNPRGDFALKTGRLSDSGSPKLTFSGIGVYHPRFFEGCSPGKFSVVPLMLRAMEKNRVTGELYRGDWDDIGTLERLQALQKKLASQGKT